MSVKASALADDSEKDNEWIAVVRVRGKINSLENDSQAKIREGAMKLV